MPTVFISYRRDDCPHQAGRLRDRLERDYGADNVFYDVDSLMIGERDVRAKITDAVRRSDVVLVLIGPGWEPERLRASGDYVRLEISEALTCDRRVIPVLVDQATMPNPESLPEDVQGLVVIHAGRLRTDPDFTRDVDQLQADIERLVAEGSRPKQRSGAAFAAARGDFGYLMQNSAITAQSLAFFSALKEDLPPVAEAWIGTVPYGFRYDPLWADPRARVRQELKATRWEPEGLVLAFEGPPGEGRYSGTVMYLAGCRAGYGGEGPHGARDVLLEAGFPEHLARLVLDHEVVHLVAGEDEPRLLLEKAPGDVSVLDEPADRAQESGWSRLMDWLGLKG